MNGANWLSIVAVFGALVLAVSAFQGQRVGTSKMLVMALAWISIFVLAAGLFAALGGELPSPGAG